MIPAINKQEEGSKSLPLVYSRISQLLVQLRYDTPGVVDKLPDNGRRLLQRRHSNADPPAGRRVQRQAADIVPAALEHQLRQDAEP